MRKSTSSEYKVPSDYQRVSSGDFAPFHDFAVHPVCAGVVTGKREGVFGKGSKKKTIRLLDVQTDRGSTTLSERVQLRGLFDAVGKGSEIFVRLTGTKKIPGQPQPMLLFDAYVRGEGRKNSRRVGGAK